MIEYGKIEAGSAVLADSLAGLSSRITLAPGEVTSKEGWTAFTAAFTSLSTRIATGAAGWKEGDVITGLPWGVAHSEEAWSQLQQWSGELETLWATWSKLSGEKLPELAKPTSLLAGLAGGAASTLGGLSSVIWAVVALVVVGVLGYVVYRIAR